MTARKMLAALAAGAIAVVVGLASPSHALADGPFTGITVTTTNTQAGAHPDMDVVLSSVMSSYTTDFPSPGTVLDYAPDLAKSFVVNLPPGVLGDPAAFATCDAQTVYQSPTACPPSSQVGVLTLDANGPGIETQNPDGSYTTAPFAQPQTPVFNMTPPAGDVARLGIPEYQGDFPVYIDIAVRDTSDYGLTATVSDIPSAQAFFGADLQLWGVPAAQSHNAERIGCWEGQQETFTSGCTESVAGSNTFLVNPTSCGPAAPVTATAQYYGDSNTYTASTTMAPVTGCSSLAFDPSLSFASATGQVGQPDAFSANLSVPQPDPGDPLPADTAAAVDGVSVTLPPGVALSPAAANGLSACSDAQFAQGSDTPVACPASSNIGSVTIDTPLLSAPLTGSLYVGAQESSDPTSGSMYRVLLNAVGQGVNVKLVGSVSANPSTGQLTASFPQNPQVPFSSLALSFTGGSNAVLANPPTCGTATSEWSISSYANPTAPVTGASSYPVTGDCGVASQFTPSLSAGTQSDRAGASSPFSFTLTRPDGQQDISGIPKIVLPKGLLADIAAVPLCTNVSACGAASQVGTATIQAGAGAAPFALQGQPVYLTGPYEGAPYGLAVVVDAQAGPFDLGTVVVRQALHIDPRTAQVTISSDPLPVILGGVPLHIRSISVDIDRRGFMRSPTSCAAQSITAEVTSSALDAPATVAPGTFTGYAAHTAQTANLATPYQAGDCSALRFSPRLGLVLSGRGQTRPGNHPQLTATLTQPAGQANLHAVSAALPLSLALDPDNSQHVCSVKAAARIACPRRTIVGTATADTRILPHPLSGDVYLVQGERRGPHGSVIKTLPTLLIPLRGRDHVNIDLTAKTSVNGAEQLVTTFGSIPDAAIRRFVLQITGGRRGILVVTGTHDLCQGPQQGTAREIGQNGRAHDVFLDVRTTACHTPH